MSRPDTPIMETSRRGPCLSIRIMKACLTARLRECRRVIHKWLGIPRWRDNILRWPVNTLRWPVNTLRWQDSNPRWQGSNTRWEDSTLRWRNKLIRWLNKLIKWDKANSRFTQVGSQFRSLGIPIKCQISQFRWDLPIRKPVSRWVVTLRLANLFKWEFILKLVSLKQVIHKWDSHKWDSHKWVVIRKLHSLYLRCSQVSHSLQVSPNSFPTSQHRDSRVSRRRSPFSSRTNLPQASLSLRHRPRELVADPPKTNHHRNISKEWEVFRNKECLSQDLVDRKCLCRQSPEETVAQCRISDVD